MLEDKGRLTLTADCESWVREALAAPGVRLAEITPHIAISSTRLPGVFHGDPADRLLIATARESAATLLTADQAILQYGSAGYVHLGVDRFPSVDLIERFSSVYCYCLGGGRHGRAAAHYRRADRRFPDDGFPCPARRKWHHRGDAVQDSGISLPIRPTEADHLRDPLEEPGIRGLALLSFRAKQGGGVRRGTWREPRLRARLRRTGACAARGWMGAASEPLAPRGEGMKEREEQP